MRRQWVISGLLILLGLLTFSIAQAHATLVRSEPPANSILASAPAEIRLWFSESVEPKFSQFTLLDSSGKTVNTPASQVDSSDAQQMFMQPGSLPDGLYTVVWHTVSAADGHSVQGSFAFSIGAGPVASGSTTSTTETIPPDGAVIRWLNLLSMSLGVGTIGFVLFVWSPAVPAQNRIAERRMNRLIWAGWALLGLTSVLMLLLQVSQAAQVSVIGALTNSALPQVITATRYGSLWLVRSALWLIWGLEIFLATARGQRRFYWLALLFGAALLLTNSLFSHASAAQDATAAIVSDWLHLLLTSLWVGGLIQFINVFGLVRRANTPALPIVEKIVGYFSNFARVAVVGLILTGLYAAWLEVGSIDALLTTLYGQVLLIKLILILPLLGIAGINLVWTHRGLQNGQAIWADRLRSLIGAEIALTIGVLTAVGVMTSLSPARTTVAQREIAASVPAANPFQETQTANGLNVQLLIAPGWVGQNTFNLTLTDDKGTPITDASLIRLRFDDLTENLGESELRIRQGQNGVYSVSGANLSQAGMWRLRISIQRPRQYDTVIDFKPRIAFAPPVAVSNDNETLPYRIPALLLAGLLITGAGGIFATRNRLLSGAGVLSRGLILIGGIFLINTTAAFMAERMASSSSSNQSSGVTAACAGLQNGNGTPGRAIADNPASPASIHIASPADGATVNNGTLDLQITTNNLTIDQQQHLHTYVDGKLASMDYRTRIHLEKLSSGIHDICVVVGDVAHTDSALRDGIRVIMDSLTSTP